MKSFKKGNLQFKKHSDSFFEYQMIKLMNKTIKLLKVIKDNSPISLAKWMIVGPEIARMLSSFDVTLNDYGESTKLCSHHENATSFENMFKKDFKNLRYEFEKVGNPFFQDIEILYTLVRKK